MAIRIKWVGHATYEITSATGTALVIDPWYTESPVVTTGLPDKADFVLVTHDHWDHVKDVAPLARSGAKVVTQPEVAARLTAEEGVSRESFITTSARWPCPSGSLARSAHRDQTQPTTICGSSSNGAAGCASAPASTTPTPSTAHAMMRTHYPGSVSRVYRLRNQSRFSGRNGDALGCVPIRVCTR
jgi:Beta-lactamase superfamily domain